MFAAGQLLMVFYWHSSYPGKVRGLLFESDRNYQKVSEAVGMLAADSKEFAFGCLALEIL